MFTRVLKGHIALDSQAFPQGTPGCLLDALARQHLWQVGRNYAHGEFAAITLQYIYIGA